MYSASKFVNSRLSSANNTSIFCTDDVLLKYLNKLLTYFLFQIKDSTCESKFLLSKNFFL